MLRLGDEPLTPAVLAAAARADGPLELELTAGARERMAAAHRTMAAATHLQDVYGRTTGVGANRDVQVDPEEARAHSVRLLRSHAGGMGRPLPPDIVRGTLVVRLAQMAAGGGGHRAEVADALIAALGMPLVEQRERMRAMRLLLADRNVYRWAGRMLVDATRLRRRERFLGRFAPRRGGKFRPVHS